MNVSEESAALCRCRLGTMVYLVVQNGAGDGDPPALHAGAHDIRGMSCMLPQPLRTNGGQLKYCQITPTCSYGRSCDQTS